MSGVQRTVLRVAFTGGPCGGKSSALPRIRAALEKEGLIVFQAQEVPTILLTGGCKFPKGNEEQIVEFERTLLQLQIVTEDSFLRLSGHAGQGLVVMLFDRGALDVSAFLTPEVWQKVIDGEGVNQQELLDRYDVVLHFRTVALSEQHVQHFKTGKTSDDNGVPVVRTSTPTEACQKDQKFQEAWKGHTNVHFIENADLFQTKVDAAIEEILRQTRDLLALSMASAQSSQDMRRGRGHQPQTLGKVQPRHRSESRRLSDRRRPAKTAARKWDHCPGALREGDPVRVFSRSADAWVDGEVVKFMDDNFARVEYEVGEFWSGKILHMHSEHLVIPSEDVVPTANP